MKLEVFVPPYNKKIFYGKMGEFFAERVYRTRLPYLINNANTIWILLEDNDQIVGGFSSFEVKKTYIEIGDIFVKDKLIDKKRLLIRKTYQLIEKNFPEKEIRIVLQRQEEASFFKKNQFCPYRETKNYIFYKREAIKND